MEDYNNTTIPTIIPLLSLLPPLRSTRSTTTTTTTTFAAMAPAPKQLSFVSDSTDPSSKPSSPSASRTAQLADFCSFVVPCIWYGSASPQQLPANRRHSAPDVTKTYSNFRKFCYDVLNATQISSSCILLSLKYIQNLKLQNPNIRGAEGSEYRLFTVALMLANKYLDDNTYTNKTWAEVSNLPVQELNIMEIEYLSALNYELFVSEQEYLHWLKECETYVARQGQYMQQYASAMLRPTKVATGVRRVSPPPSSRNPSLPSINISNLMPVPLATMTVQKRGFSDMGYEPPAKRPNVYGVRPQNNPGLPNTPPNHYGSSYKVPLLTPIPTYPQNPQILPLSPAYTPPSSQQYYSAAPVVAFTSLPNYAPYNTSTLTVAAPVPLYPASVVAPSTQYYSLSNPRRALYQQQQAPFGNSNMAFSSDFTFQSAIVM